MNTVQQKKKKKKFIWLHVDCTYRDPGFSMGREAAELTEIFNDMCIGDWGRPGIVGIVTCGYVDGFSV